MRLWPLLLIGCSPVGTPPTPTEVDGGQPPTEQALPYTERPAELFHFSCRELVGASFVSVDPSAPQHLRARSDNVLLRSDDEGRTWQRAPVDTGLAANTRFIGPVVVAFANTDPHTADAGFRVSTDRGATWLVPEFRESDDGSLPPATVIATLGDARLAWSPSGVLRVSLGGAPWFSEANATMSAGGDDVHAVLGAREWLLHASERQLYRSQNAGRSWQRLAFKRFTAIELVGERGVIAGAEGQLWISRDDGDSWVQRTGLSSLFAVGPAEGELWGVKTAIGAQPPLLMHSVDWGESFAPVQISLGAAGFHLATEPGVRRVGALADGRRVMVPRLDGAGLRASSRMVCVEAPGAGALEQAEAARRDDPGSATLWAGGAFGFALGTRQQVVPLREAGRAFGITSRTFADTVAITGGTRLPSGDVALLLKPRAAIDLNAGPPMRVQVLDGTSLMPTRSLEFTSLLRTSSGRESKYLESGWLQALPDGGLRTTTIEGDYPIGVDPAVWVPWPSNGRWGAGGQGAQLVTQELVEASHFFRLSSDLAETAVFCSATAPLPTRCIRYEGQVQDWGVRNGTLYLLDAWRGEVLEGSFMRGDGVLRPVLTGLASATSLFVPTDDDEGLYVVDTHLYRFVPGSNAARRP